MRALIALLVAAQLSVSAAAQESGAFPPLPSVQDVLGAAERPVVEVPAVAAVEGKPLPQTASFPRSFRIDQKSCAMPCFALSVEDGKGGSVELGAFEHRRDFIYSTGGTELLHARPLPILGTTQVFEVRGPEDRLLGRFQIEQIVTKLGFPLASRGVIYRVLDERGITVAVSEETPRDAERIVLKTVLGAEAASITRDFDHRKYYGPGSDFEYFLARQLLPWPILVDRWQVEVAADDLDPLIVAALAAYKSDAMHDKR
ncbi:MAG: hypothetical protein WC969_08185 [Elusimicrobiota bacterium]|jgi:hypothetical protein